MFEVGFTEILLILGLALLVLGPEKLPGLARKIGAWTGRARAMANQLRTQLEQEVTLDELSKTRGNDAGTGPASGAEPGQSTTPEAPADPGSAESAAESHLESGAESANAAAGHSEASSTKPAS